MLNFTLRLNWYCPLLASYFQVSVLVLFAVTFALIVVVLSPILAGHPCNLW